MFHKFVDLLAHFTFKEMLPAWISFVIIIGIVMALSKYELGIILTIGAVGLALLAEVNIFQSWVHIGPRSASVTSVRCEEVPYEAFDDFIIKQ